MIKFSNQSERYTVLYTIKKHRNKEDIYDMFNVLIEIVFNLYRKKVSGFPRIFQDRDHPVIKLDGFAL